MKNLQIRRTRSSGFQLWRGLAWSRFGLFLLLALALTGMECPAQSTVVPYTFSTIGGQPGVSGWADTPPGTQASPGSLAQFAYPTSVAVDNAGNLYVADQGNDVIRKMTQVSPGNWVVSTLAGEPGTPGYFDNPVGSSAQFNEPSGVAVDSLGNVYVADSGNNLIREVTPEGAVSTIAGNASILFQGSPQAGYVNTTALQSQFDFPTGVGVDSAGNVYVADENNDVIRKLTIATSMVSTLAGSEGGFGTNDGLGSQAQFYYPYGITVDSAGNIYVADLDNNEIRKVTPAGMVSTLAGSPPTQNQIQYWGAGIPSPNQDGTGSGAGFYFPYGVAVDGATNVYVADTWDNEIRKVTPQRVVTTLGGMPTTYEAFTVPPYPVPGYQNGAGSSALFGEPCGVAVDKSGNLYVADTENSVIRIGTAPVVQVVALEVTQVIQDWNNSIPLVQDKETYVRAHLQLGANNNSSFVTVAGALLYGTRLDGSPLPGPPLNPINEGGLLNVIAKNASNAMVRGFFANTLNFQLPPTWLNGSIRLQLAWPGGLQPMNVVPQDCSVQVTFVPVAVPRINFYPINWTDGTGALHQVDPTLLDNLYLRILACYPVASVVSTVRPALSVAYTGSQPTDKAIEVGLDKIRNSENFFPYRIYHGVLPVDPDSPQSHSGTTFRIPGPVSYSMMFGSSIYGNGRQTVSHEIGHNLGINHDVSLALFGKFLQIDDPDAEIGALGAANEVGPLDYVYPSFEPFHGFIHGAPTLGPMTSGDNSLIYGLDTLTLKDTASGMEPVVAPTNNSASDQNYFFDLMSYCRPPGFAGEDAWPSSVTYTTLIQELNTYFGSITTVLPGVAGAPAKGVINPKNHRPRSPTPQGGGEDYLVVQGSVNFEAGTAQFLPCLLLTTTNAPPLETPGSNFVVEALDNSGNVLEMSQFDLELNIFAENNTNDTANFTIFLTPDSSIHKLVLLNNGVALATLTASPTAPTLTLTAPNGGQTFSGGLINAAWSGSVGGGETLTYMVQYSADDGLTWETEGVGLPGESLAIDSSLLEATTEGLIRVIASDGLDIITAQSAATFTVQPHPPSVSINAPMDGSVFMGDQQLFLDASANDMQDGPLSGANVQWSSDLIGPLGTGNIVNFDARILSEGYHTITVTATDSDGLTNSAETRVLILHYSPPQLSFQMTPGVTELGTYYPPTGTVSWPSYYTNYVLQSSSNLASGWSTVTSVLPQPNGNQQSVGVDFSNTTLFFRLILQF